MPRIVLSDVGFCLELFTANCNVLCKSPISKPETDPKGSLKYLETFIIDSFFRDRNYFTFHQQQCLLIISQYAIAHNKQTHKYVNRDTIKCFCFETLTLIMTVSPHIP